MTTLRILVTGGAGFIGSHLCASLLDQGHDVTCLDDLSSGSQHRLPRQVRFIPRDVREPFAFECDELYHLACPASPFDYAREPWKTIQTATVGTAHAIRCARQARAKLVVASTSEVYGDAEHPQREEHWGHVDPVGPRSCYVEGKRAAEAMCVAMTVNWSMAIGIARLFNVYGPGMREDDGRVIPSFIAAARKGGFLEVMGDGQQTRSFCYVDDAVRGLVALMDHIGENQHPVIVNLGNPDERTILSVAEDIEQRLGGRITVRGSPLEFPRRRCPDIRRAKALLGWSPEIPFGLGLDRTIASWESDSRCRVG